MQAISKFKNSAPGYNQTPFGGILSRIRWDLPRYIRIPNLTFLASPIRPDLRKGVLHLKRNWPLDPDHASFGGNLSLVRWDLPRSIRVMNLKFLASPFPNLRKGFKI